MHLTNDQVNSSLTEVRSENPLAPCNTHHQGTKKILELKPLQHVTGGKREARSMEEQSEIYDPIFMKLPRLYCNSSMQTKAAIDFS